MPRAVTRLLLLCLACLGITGMVLYKFKYEQMKDIVDGAGLEAVDRYLHSSNLVPTSVHGHKESPFELPLVTWTNVSSTFVFSAFLCQSTDGFASNKEFCAVGFGLVNSPNLECSIWFDLGKELLSVPGFFSFTASKLEGSRYLIYEFKCVVQKIRSIHRKPYAFILKTPDIKTKVIIPIFKIKLPSTFYRSAICVYPDTIGFEWKSMIEFISFHEIVGFTDILIYDNGINFGFLDKIKRLVQPSSNLKSVSVLRWNLPVIDPVSNQLVQKDCSYRTSGFTTLTVFLNWNQFILPGDGKKIDYLLSSIKGSNIPMVPTKRCCTDAFDDRRSEKTWPIILRKTLCIPNEESFSIKINSRPPETSTNSNQLSESLTFAKCQGLALSDLVPVFSMWKYSSDILSSHWLTAWKESSLFSITSDE